MATAKKPWADGPFELISSSQTGLKEGEKVVGTQTITVEMIIVHNFVLRGINSIYNQCIKVQDSPDDIADFVNYAIIWGQGVEEHHHGEEHDFFPAIEEKAGVPGLMSANVEQHKMFHDGLEQYNKYLISVRDGKEAFIGQKLKNIIDAFMPVLRQHLSDEIDTLRGLSKYEDKLDWGKWFNEFQEEILKKAQTDEFKTTVFPWALQNHDKTFEGGVFAHWPPLPWIVGVLMRWFFMPKHKSWWRFAPCDYHGKPKDLPFA